ncbi:hypothetical protein ACS0TY_006082 [Phlomoides rotata]
MVPKKGAKLSAVAKKKVEKVVNPLYEKRPKQFGIGGALPPKKDLHRPEDKAQKKERLLKRAQAEAEGKTPELKKPIVVKYGLKSLTITRLSWLSLPMMSIQLSWLSGCLHFAGKNGDPIVHKKSASVLCLTSANFNDKFDETRKKWGGGVMGSKSQAKTKAKEKVLAKEAAQRLT